MYKLGNELTTDDKKNEIRRILTARRKLYNAGVELLECDHVYAEGIKAELERHTFANYILRDYISRKAEWYIPASEAITLKLADKYYK